MASAAPFHRYRRMFIGRGTDFGDVFRYDDVLLLNFERCRRAQELDVEGLRHRLGVRCAVEHHLRWDVVVVGGGSIGRGGARVIVVEDRGQDGCLVDQVKLRRILRVLLLRCRPYPWRRSLLRLRRQRCRQSLVRNHLILDRLSIDNGRDIGGVR